MTKYRIKNQRKNERVGGYKLKKRSEEERKYERSTGVKSDNDRL